MQIKSALRFHLTSDRTAIKRKQQMLVRVLEAMKLTWPLEKSRWKFLKTTKQKPDNLKTM